MSEPSREAVELPEGMRRYSPTVEYRQFRGQGFKPTGVMKVDPEGGYIDVGLLPAIEAQTLERVRQALTGLPRYMPVNGSSGTPENRARVVLDDEGRYLNREAVLAVLNPSEGE